MTVWFYILLIALIAIIIYLWRWFVMNSNELLYTFVTKLIDKVDKDEFWAQYGEALMEKLVEKLF